MRFAAMNGLMMMTALAGCVDGVDEDAATDASPAISDDGFAEGELGTLRVRDVHGEIHTVTVKNEHGRAIYQGDIDLGAFARTKDRGFAVKGLDKRWPNNVVRYAYQRGPGGCIGPICPGFCDVIAGEPCRDLSSFEITQVENAIQTYRDLTGLDFQESTTPPFIALAGWNNTDKSVTHGDELNMNSGFSPLITFADGFAGTPGPDGTDHGYRTAIHELGHALGLSHEQKRGDANSTIDFHAICMEEPSQFETPSGGMKFLSPFDIDSMMMYSTWSFSRQDTNCSASTAATENCCPTILTKSGTTTFTFKNDTGSTINVNFEGNTHTMAKNEVRTFTGGVIPRSSDFSKEDLNTLYQMYPPSLGQNETGDNFAKNAVTGDFNGDGYTDLAVAAPSEGPFGHPTSGAVFIYRGTFGGLEPWRVIEEDATGVNEEGGDAFGTGMAAIDLTGDGNDELLVGAPNKRTNGTNHTGGVYVFSSDREGFTLRDYFFPSDLGYSNGSNDDFGSAISVGQENGETRAYIGAPGTSSSAGRVYQLRYDKNATRYNVSGTGTFVAINRLGGDQSVNNRYGSAIATSHLDSDGNDEVVIGAPGAGTGGKLFIWKGGASLSFAGSIFKPGSTATGSEKFGSAIKLGKFRNLSSGKRQIAVSAPWESNGRVYILDVTVGATTLSLDSWQMLQNTGAGEFGFDLAVGDLSGDGVTDLAVGAPTTAGGVGGAWVYLGTGGATPLIAVQPLYWTSFAEPLTTGIPTVFDGFGATVAIGQFDGGGPKDLAIGGPGTIRDGQSGAGAMWFWRGQFIYTPQWVTDNSFTNFVDQESQPQK